MRRSHALRSLRPWSLSLLVLVACHRAATPADGGTTPPVASADAATTAADAELAARLERLEGELEKARVEHHVPGMAIAVVKNGEVVLARGFGLSDLEHRTPATDETVFSIGSSTKAFTSTMVGMLVDEGKLNWDDPIDKYVPELKLPVDNAGEPANATLRDAMSHRTGFTRMSLLWVGGAVDTPEMFTRASTAEPWAKYRKEFLYNNVVYASAGEASARVAKMAWPQLLQERLLKPLHMDGTTADQDAAKNNPKRAQGYRWEDATEKFLPLPMRPIPAAAPAGAIYSNAQDMAKWVQFQLAGGKVDGKPLISAASLKETRTAQMQMAPSMAYGLGWMLGVQDGKPIVHHGGNIDGYSAMVAMMPEDDVGFALLTNTSSTPLQNAALGIVFTAMTAPLDDGKAAKGGAENFDRYLGKFVANFGPFKDADLTVTAKDGKLFVDVPGQMNFEVKPPGKDGRRSFAITDQIAVSFDEDEAGKVVALRLHQAGFDFEALRRGYVPPAEIPVDELKPLLGSYDNDKLGLAQISIANNRLAIQLPKQMPFELQPPDADGKRKARIKPAVAVEFRPASGAPSSLVIHEGDQQLEFTRKATKRGKPLPTVDALMKLRRAAIAKGTLRVRGKIRAPQSAIDGTVEWAAAPDGRQVTTADFGKFGRIVEVALRDRAWTDASFAPLDEAHGKYLDQARAGLPMILTGDWRTVFDAVAVTAQRELDGKRVYVVELKLGEAPTIVATVDAKTGDVLELSQAVMVPGAGGIPTTTKLSEYRRVAGVRIPHHLERSDQPSGRTVMDIESVEVVNDEEAAVFPAAPSR
jgi:CubicO group peptidase (beta-lactamase class C family)